jgi:hypothetical protein
MVRRCALIVEVAQGRMVLRRDFGVVVAPGGPDVLCYAWWPKIESWCELDAQ